MGEAETDLDLDDNGNPRPKPPEQLRVRRVDGDKRRKGVVLTLSGGTYTVSELHQDGMSRPKESVARRIANIGMSPRARNALLSSRPPSTGTGKNSRERHTPLNMIGLGTAGEFDVSSPEEEEEGEDEEGEGEGEGVAADVGDNAGPESARSSGSKGRRVVGTRSKEGSLDGLSLSRGSKGSEGTAAAEGEEQEEDEDDESEEDGAGFADVVMRMRLKKAMKTNPLLQKIRQNRAGKARQPAASSGSDSWIQDALDAQKKDEEKKEEESEEEPPPPVEVVYGSDGEATPPAHEEEEWLSEDDDDAVDLSHRTARLTLGIAGGVANSTHNAHEINSKNHIDTSPKPKKKNAMVTSKAPSKRGGFRRNSVMAQVQQIAFAQPPSRPSRPSR